MRTQQKELFAADMYVVQRTLQQPQSVSSINIWFDHLSVMQLAHITGIRTRDYDECMYPLYEFHADVEKWWDRQSDERKQEIYQKI